MKILTITQSGYELVADHNILPGEFSANVEIEFIKDIAYKDYTVLPSLKYGNKTYPLPFVDGLVTLPPQAFEQDGPIYLAFLLSNGDEHINTYSVELFVPESVGGSNILPDDKEIWVKVVQNQVEQIYQKEYKEPLEETTRKSIEATNTAKEETKKLVDVREDVELKLNNGEFVPDFKIGTVQTGATSKATITGTKKEPILNLTMQKGDKGDSNVLSIGTVQKGDEPKVTITGESPSQIINFTLPKGDSNVLSIGTVQKGSEAKATITGTSPNQVLNLTLPVGNTGEKGDTGPTNKLAIGTVQTGEASSATITGIAPNQILNLILEKGKKGDKGDGVLVPHIVTVLPATGETSDIYFLIEGSGYITYMWVESKWIVVGSGNVDLNNYYNKEESDGKFTAFKTRTGTSIRAVDTSMLDICSRICETVYDMCKEEPYFSISMSVDLYNDYGAIFDYMGIVSGRYIVDIYTDALRFNFIFKSVTNSITDDTHMYTATLTYDSTTKKATFPYSIENKFLRFASAKELENYYTKSQLDSKLNSLKPYGIDAKESSLIKTLDRIYKDQIKDVGNYDPIEKIFYININTENASYNFMGLKNNSSYYVKMYQDIRQGDRGVLFTFMNFAVENMDDSFLHVGQDSSGNLIESQHVVKRKTDGFVQSDTIKNEIVLTQAQYDALSSKDNATVYFITE